MRTLDPRQLNRAVLARQLQLERARLPLPRALKDVAGFTGIGRTALEPVFAGLELRRCATTDGAAERLAAFHA